jgi:glucan phosphoethanolaminetransferase (alkaline phosphatase superfamily)
MVAAGGRVIDTPYSIVMVPVTVAAESTTVENKMSPVFSVYPLSATVVTGMLPTVYVAWANAAIDRPRNITAAIRRVFVFIYKYSF